ncbi:MAG: DUF924 family protein [Rhodanobacter sp.]
MYKNVLKFWFKEIEPKMWWTKDPAFDEEIRQRFLPLLQSTAQGEQYAWRTTPKGRLAEIIVLDQFSRNVFRDTPQAFAQDPMALVLSQEAVAAGALKKLAQGERSFLLMPHMHSESATIHVQAEALYREFAAARNLGFEIRHKAIIDQFGRYPHRNKLLGRKSSAAEVAFLKQPGSRF